MDQEHFEHKYGIIINAIIYDGQGDLFVIVFIAVIAVAKRRLSIICFVYICNVKDIVLQAICILIM